MFEVNFQGCQSLRQGCGFSMNNGPLTVLRQPVRYTSVLMTTLHSSDGKLVGGFNPSEKYARQIGFIFPK